jgi:hypothetical protein
VRLAHSIPTNGGLILRYPSQIEVDKDYFNIQADLRDYGVEQILSSSKIDYSSREVIFWIPDGKSVGVI